jgi:hypothetical protein
MCEIYATSQIKHTCNIPLKKQMKHWRHTLATYVYNHCNICNIPIYFCNIRVKQLKHTSKASETFQIYTCNMHHILVRSPPPSALGHRSRSRRRSRRASAPRPNASPCAGGVVGVVEQEQWPEQ